MVIRLPTGIQSMSKSPKTLSSGPDSAAAAKPDCVRPRSLNTNDEKRPPDSAPAKPPDTGTPFKAPDRDLR